MLPDQAPSRAAAGPHPDVGPYLAERLVRRAGRRWMLVLVLALVFGGAVYWLSTQTVTGQTLENAALRGNSQANPEQRERGHDAMGLVTMSSVALATLVVAAIGLLRRQRVLAIAGVAIILVGQAITQILKHFVLPRPDLALVPTKHMENTLPSGHTTVAMTLLFALLVVVPYRYRGVAMFFALTATVGMGAFTIAAHAHRLSDTLAADAVALVVGCGASYLLARTGRLRAVVSPGAARYTLRTIFVVIVATFGVATLVAGTLLTMTGWREGPLNQAGQFNLYLGAHALAFAGSVAAALVFWWTWYRLEAKRSVDPQAIV